MKKLGAYCQNCRFYKDVICICKTSKNYNKQMNECGHCIDMQSKKWYPCVNFCQYFIKVIDNGIVCKLHGEIYYDNEEHLMKNGFPIMYNYCGNGENLYGTTNK